VNKIKLKAGFTLIELMIVVVIIGILAAMAIPRLMAVPVRTKQSEAKLILKQIYVNQRTYRQQGNTYFIPAADASAANPQAFKEIWIEIMLPSNYTYSIVADAMTFTATATALNLDDDPAPDIWTINHLGVLTCVSDDAML
jgi:prepilin-type N-terminal cleavage/methylation domain-containing protein